MIRYSTEHSQKTEQRLKEIAENTEGKPAKASLIVTLRSSIVYTPVVERLTSFLPPESEAELTAIKTAAMRQFHKQRRDPTLTIPTYAEEKTGISEAMFNNFLDLALLSDAPLKIPELKFSNTFIKAKLAFNRKNYAKALREYEEAIQVNQGNDPIELAEKAEIYFELHCLYKRDETRRFDEINVLYQCYLLMFPLTLKLQQHADYYNYWHNRIPILLANRILNYCNELTSIPDKKNHLDCLHQLYGITTRLAVDAVVNKAIYEYLSIKILSIMFDKIEAYCAETRAACDSNNPELAEELLKADFEYDFNTDSVFYKPDEGQKRPKGYKTHKVNFEEEFKDYDIDAQPRQQLFETKAQYANWVCRHQQPFAPEAEYIRERFPKDKKRFPNPKTIKLPTEKKEEQKDEVKDLEAMDTTPIGGTPTVATKTEATKSVFVNPSSLHKIIAIRIMHELMPATMMQKYLDKLLTFVDVIPQHSAKRTRTEVGFFNQTKTPSGTMDSDSASAVVANNDSDQNNNARYSFRKRKACP